MKNDTDIIALRQPESVDDPLTEIARDGARRMLAAALRAEADAFVAQHAEDVLPDGRQRVVRHGYGPERSIQTGIGALDVRARRCVTAPLMCRPRKRSASPQASCRVSHALPPVRRMANARRSMRCCPCFTCAASRWAISRRRWPRSSVPDAPNLSPSVISRLTGEWQQEYDHWQRRDLSARRYVYIWADGVYLQARMEPQAECMLVILGATPEGSEAEKKTPWGGVFLPNELVGFQVGVRESAQSWRELLVDIKASRPRGAARDRRRRRGHGVLEGPRRGLPGHAASTVLG